MDRHIDRDEEKEEKEDHSAFTSPAVCSGGVAYGRMSFLLQKCGQIHFFFPFFISVLTDSFWVSINIYQWAWC